MESSSSDSETESEEIEDEFCSGQREGAKTSGSPSDLGKKRKQETETYPVPNRGEKEPSNKRVKAVSKLKRFSQSFQRLSLKTDAYPAYSASRPWSRTGSAQVKSRNCKLWSETFESVGDELSAREIRRQEVIFELTQGEQALIDDLNIAKKAYYEPMLKLSIIPENELNQIFGSLYSLTPLHEDLTRRLQNERKKDGTVDCVGATLLEWLPSLACLYQTYCCNQVAAKALLDHKKQDHRVHDFLQRCLESPFSRKLDLWNFLDIPRSRLVKYPLLLREILRHSPNDHPDQQHLEEAINIVQGIVAEINKKTGESECQYYKERLSFPEESQRDPLINNSKVLCCHGDLKNNRGVKLHVFLFQEVLVITRAVTCNDQLCYQLYRQPIPVRDLVLADLQDGEVRLGGSIRGAFSNNERTKNFFRVSARDSLEGQTHSLQANDAFNKQQWLNCVRQAKDAVHRALGDKGLINCDRNNRLTPNGISSSCEQPKHERMDHSDNESDCSMDTSEISGDYEQMEETDYCANQRRIETNV
uniref:Rho guanine nucleotide exchange factor 3 n=1 Tax=Callorhinchus milii TaxID=7868 RepID=V9KDK6_CALMI